MSVTVHRLGVRSALVAVSGDLAFSDAPPGERGWRIGIRLEDPAVVKFPAAQDLTNAGSRPRAAANST
jgi:thiamine biosynthesis lipoprotein